MPLPPLLLSLLLTLTLLPFSLSQAPNSFYINCGASNGTTDKVRQWLPDTGFVETGTPKKVPYNAVLQILSTVRSFPIKGNSNKKFCYVIGPVIKSAKYLVRTTYFYGGVNGPQHKTPPVFDQIVDGTLWSVVNTSQDYANDMSSYYEGVFKAGGKSISVCLGVNEKTDSDMFISAIEVNRIEDSVYNSTDFDKFGLSSVARHNFGYNGSIVRAPDDPFDRFWQPFGPQNSDAKVPNVSVSGFWNLPPAKIFETQLTVDKGPLELQWPQGPLPNSIYYIALYFASASESTFSISINDVPYIANLNATSAGVSVFANQWPLSGLTKLKFTPGPGSSGGPLVNGGEVFNVLMLGRRTLTRDVIALQNVKSNLRNTPSDWSGDPCSPAGYSWTGITCSNGTRVRITAINLLNMGVSGSLSPAIAKLTALDTLVLANNRLSGHIPSSLGALRHLEILGLENNNFNGTIPLALGEISSLRELHLENNNLIGRVPRNLLQKPGLRFTFSPGNNLSLPTNQTR